MTALFSFCVSAAQSGTCGDNLTWTLDENGLLTISGKGNMYDYESGYGGVFDANTAPWWGQSVTAVKMLDGVTSIGDWAFSGCDFTSIEIPDSVTSIEGSVFMYCSNLTSIEIPDGVTNIGGGAFRGCSGLKSIDLPDSVTSIGGSTFFGCSNLTSIKIPDGVTSIEGSTFMYCSNLTSIEIPDGVTNIGGSAFRGCSGLKSIDLPDSVTSIGGGAFMGCGFTSIEIPEGVTCIEYDTFMGCANLTRIEIPDSVTSIRDMAFSYCSGLASIEIPKSVTSIEKWAFDGCSNLTIYGYEGSYAQKYAKENDIPFKKIPKVVVNGSEVAFVDQKPVIEDGRTLVPARGVFEALGAEVSWVDSTKTAIVKTNEKEIAVQIGRNYLVVNGKTIEIDVPAKIINGRTMIPLRAVAEALDCEVNWDGNTYTATIKS